MLPPLPIILICDCVPNMLSLLSLQQPLHYNNCSRMMSYSHYIFIHRYFIHCFQSSEFVYHILYFLSFFCIVLNKRRFRPNNSSASVLFLKIADIFWRRIVTWMEVIIETCSRVVISLTPSRTVNTFANVGESASASGNTFCLKY